MTDLRRYRVTVTSPTGDVLDITELLDGESVGSVSETVSDDISKMDHGSLSIAINNSHGEIEAFLADARPTDTYEVAIEREMLDGTWERFFAGVLDLSTSLVYDDVNKTAGVTVFSYSKLLEKASAAAITRTIATKAASVSSGSKSVTITSGSTSDLVVGDLISIDDGAGTQQDFTVDQITDSTHLLTVESATATFTNNALLVRKPYYHDKTPDYLLGLVAAAAGVSTSGTIATRRLADFPVTTPLTLAGGNARGRVVSLVQMSGQLTALIIGSYQDIKRADATSPWTAYTGGVTAGVADWTRYASSEPGTLINTGVTDNYYLEKLSRNYTNGITYAIGLNAGNLRITGSNGFSLVVDTASGWALYDCDYDSQRNRVFYSFRRSDNTLSEFGYVELSGPTKVVLDNTACRVVCIHNLIRVLAFHEDETSCDVWNNFISPAKEAAFALPPGCGKVDTDALNNFDRWIAWICRGPNGLGSYVAVVDRFDWRVVVTYPISSENCYVSNKGPSFGYTGTTKARLTKFPAYTSNMLFGWAGGEWFILAAAYEGVVRFADFTDMSVGAACRELAIVTNSLVSVDKFKTLSLVNRMTMGEGDPVAELSTPIEQRRRPISEHYAQSVTVHGVADNGDDISVTAGDTGASASRLDVDTKFGTTGGICAAIASSTLSFVSKIREQRDNVHADDGTPMSAFDAVTLDGRRFVVWGKQTNPRSHQHELVLLEVA